MLDKLVVKLLTLKAWLSSERGQDLMEYALITGGIAIVLIVALLLFTNQFSSLFGSLKNCIDFNSATSCP
jgi:Flp pilus assembly pilin Flp